jgi:hypothetical protein
MQAQPTLRRIVSAIAALTTFGAMTAVSVVSSHASDNPWYDKYLALDSSIGDDFYQSTDSAVLGWGESYVLDSYAEVYHLTGDTIWLDKIVTHADTVIANADDDDGDGYLGWGTSRYSPVEVDNDGMETPAPGDSSLPKDWTRFQTNSSNALRTTDSYTGNYAVRIDSDGQLWRKLYQPMTTYEPDTIYTLRINAKTNGSAARGRAYVHDRTTGEILCSITVDNTAWAQYSTECRTPASTGHDLQVWLGHLDYTVDGGRAYFDDVKISGKYPYIVHDGMIGTAIAHFVELVYETPALHSAYLTKANHYRAFLEDEIVPRWESSSYIGNTWASLSGSTGTYKQSANFDAFSHTATWTYLPYNQSLAFARMQLVLHRVNDDATYLDRAQRNGQYFKNALTLSGDDYVWNYAYYASTIEDTSHANLDIGAAREMYHDGVVFTATDMQRFTNTIATRMWNGSVTAPTVTKWVDGSGDTSFSKYLVEWTQLAQWKRNLYWVAAEQYRDVSLPSGYDLLALARIMTWDVAKLLNQGFELETSFDSSYPAQWYRTNATSTTAYRDASNAHTGEYGLTVESTGGSAQLVSQQWEDWATSTSYTIEFAGKTGGGSAGGLVYVENLDTGAVLASQSFSGSSWSPYSLTFTSPSVAGQDVRVYIGNDDPAQPGTAHVDDIAIRPTSTPW